MLQNLQELKSYTEALAKRVPRITQRVTIKEPGLSADDLSKLQIIGIPSIYENCIGMFNLFGIAVGYFAMWPGSIKAGNMVEALIAANQDSYPGSQDARGSGLVVVAQEEANLICVGRADSAVPDVVYLLDVMRSPSVERQDVAPNFEKFLLLAGNLHEVGRKYSGDVNGAAVAIVECCRYFGCSEDQIKFWISRAEIAAS